MERFERQAVSRGLPLYVDLLDKGRACDPQARQFLKIFRLGFTTPARRIENSDLAAGEPRPPKPKATACEGSSSNLHSPLRYPRAESFRQRLFGQRGKNSCEKRNGRYKLNCYAAGLANENWLEVLRAEGIGLMQS